ncbi:aminomethyl-transferring glycine dehydrogenase subunit GcvPB [Thiotrichales bacterium HSG1]|nr:aminomethyl-transferring glycine dehydrogenase subunit GcvPB [Thiotrichales bacterium HSG1]
MLIFEQSSLRRTATSQYPAKRKTNIPTKFLRKTPPVLPQVSEMQVVRHYTRLSQKNFSIDTHFYPLGSCTMKYNPRVCNTLAMLPEFLSQHPTNPEIQGTLACLYDLQEILKEITGMQAISLAPAAGAQGEFAGVAMLRAYHDANNEQQRTEILVPDAAHGTNPASAVMCGFKVREIPTNDAGDVDIEILKTMVGPQTAGIMLTNPSTLGVFERQVKEISQCIHSVGGLLYYDGANLNAILGKVRPGDMGFDVIHINLHKTFSTPHGGGGPGAGPVGVNNKLLPFLPIPTIGYQNNSYIWLTETEYPQTIGRLSANAGNVGILLRAYVYIRLLGREGLTRVADFSTLNANYLQAKLDKFDLAFPNRRASHEFSLTLKKQSKQ